MTSGSPPLRTATTELVVPRSIPTARAMCGAPSIGVVRVQVVWSGRRLDGARPDGAHVKRTEPGRLNFPHAAVTPVTSTPARRSAQRAGDVAVEAVRARRPGCVTIVQPGAVVAGVGAAGPVPAAGRRRRGTSSTARAPGSEQAHGTLMRQLRLVGRRAAAAGGGTIGVGVADPVQRPVGVLDDSARGRADGAGRPACTPASSTGSRPVDGDVADRVVVQPHLVARRRSASGSLRTRVELVLLLRLVPAGQGGVPEQRVRRGVDRPLCTTSSRWLRRSGWLVQLADERGVVRSGRRGRRSERTRSTHGGAARTGPAPAPGASATRQRGVAAAPWRPPRRAGRSTGSRTKLEPMPLGKT